MEHVHRNNICGHNIDGNVISGNAYYTLKQTPHKEKIKKVK